MKRIIVAFAFIILSCNSAISADTIPPLEKMLAKEYAFKLLIKQRSYGFYDSSESSNISNGFVQRNNNVVYSKKERTIGIFQDSLIFTLDEKIKLATLGPKRIDAAFLLLFFDPYELYSFAKENNAPLQKSLENENLIYNYSLKIENFPLEHIIFYFDSSKSRAGNSFHITLTGHLFFDKVIIVINYTSVSKFEKWSLEDYIETKNGVFELKPKYKNYSFFNSIGLTL